MHPGFRGHVFEENILLHILQELLGRIYDAYFFQNASVYFVILSRNYELAGGKGR
jgi:hypothetical protein